MGQGLGVTEAIPHGSGGGMADGWMGRGQVVRRGTLDPVFEGSNPSAPATGCEGRGRVGAAGDVDLVDSRQSAAPDFRLTPLTADD